MWERALRRAAVPSGLYLRVLTKAKVELRLGAADRMRVARRVLGRRGGDTGTPHARYPNSLEGQFPAGVGITAAAVDLRWSWLASAGRHVLRLGDRSPRARLTDARAAWWERRSGREACRVRRERKGREEEDDLRPAVRELAVCGDLRRSLRAPSGVERPVLEVCDPRSLGGLSGSSFGLACRTHQWIESEGSRTEPLAPDAARPEVASERAS